MLHIIDPASHVELGSGPFRIRRIRPGHGLARCDGDTGHAGLGLVDHAHLSAGLVVPMHEHRDDEIVSYLRSGALTHEDTTGQTEQVRPDRLMVMNAGSGFSHEERLPEGDDVHMLQIFIRPSEAGLEPMVQFAELDAVRSVGSWRTLVVPEGEAGPANVRQALWLYDVHLPSGESVTPPRREGFDQWLYVFSGAVTLDDGRRLPERTAILASGPESIGRLSADGDTDLVLFQLDPRAERTLQGSLSRGR